MSKLKTLIWWLEIKYILYFEEVLQTIRYQVIDRYAVGIEKQKRLNQIFGFLIVEEQILVDVLLLEVNADEKCFCSLWFLIWVNSIMFDCKHTFVLSDFDFIHLFIFLILLYKNFC